MIKIYHNPSCSKSREALALLEARNIEPTVILYLKTPPSVDELRQLVSLLGFSSARELMRKKEDLYQQLDLDNTTLSEDDLLAAMHQNPKLIERPIVVANGKARLGRPAADNVLSIL